MNPSDPAQPGAPLPTILERRKPGLFVRLVSDESLTKKAALNALSSSINYGAQLAVAFLITPLMVAGLGDYFYGTWQTLNRVVGYLSPAVGKPTQTLRWTLANQQAANDSDQKRRLVGSAFSVWLVFLPLLAVGAALVTWFVPFWLKTPPPSIGHVRLTILLLVGNLIVMNLVAVPQSVLEGENLGYKRMGLAAMLSILGGALTWLILTLGTGMVGVAAVAFVVTALSGLFYLSVARSNIHWFGIRRPPLRETWGFLRLSVWFVAWDILMKLMVMSDVVILAFLHSVESVTSYSLTKQAPETIISLVAIMVFGIIPGLGGIVGSGQLKKAAQVRGEIMTLTWLMLTVLGTVILAWNRVFIQLWVGERQYAGPLANLLMILVVYQFTLIKNDAAIIDLTLRIEDKVRMGAVSTLIALMASGVLVVRYHMGISGMCLGLILGRLILSLGYPVLIGRFLKIAPSEQINGLIRPAAVTLLLFLVGFLFSLLQPGRYFAGMAGWLFFIGMAGLTACLVLAFAFYLGLSGPQRRAIWIRMEHLASRASGEMRR